MFIDSSAIVLNVFFFQALELILCFCVFSVWCNMRKQVALMAHSREELQVNLYSNWMFVCLSVLCNMRKQVVLMAHSREELQVNL